MLVSFVQNIKYLTEFSDSTFKMLKNYSTAILKDNVKTMCG